MFNLYTRQKEGVPVRIYQAHGVVHKYVFGSETYHNLAFLDWKVYKLQVRLLK